jgi:hypothetical protein
MEDVETYSNLVIFESRVHHSYRCLELITQEEVAFDFLFRPGPQPELMIRVWIGETDTVDSKITGLSSKELKIFQENNEYKIKQFCLQLQKRLVCLESDKQWVLTIRNILKEQAVSKSIHNARRKYTGRSRPVKSKKLHPNGMQTNYW